MPVFMPSRNSARPFAVLFIVPSGDFLPSGIVRVRQFLPLLDAAGIAHQTLSYYSPRADRFATEVRSGARSVPLRPLMLALAGLFQVFFKWTTRMRVLLLAPRVNVVFFQGVLPPVWYVKVLKPLNSRVVLDMDDAIFLGNPQRGLRGVADRPRYLPSPPRAAVGSDAPVRAGAA